MTTADQDRTDPDTVGLVDPHWQGEGEPPPWAVIGRWQAGEDGSVREFAENAEYRPSPTACGWPPPTDPVAAAVRAGATGYGLPEDVHRALAGARVAVLLDEYAEIGGFTPPDGDPAVVVYSARSWPAAAGDPGHAVIGPGTLPDRLPPGLGIVVNPGAPAAMRLDPGALWRAVDVLDREGGRGRPLRPFD